jgi:hypothetical protein
LDDEDRDDGRVAALAKTLRLFVDASRRAEDGPTVQDRTDAVLEAQRLRHVAWALTSDEDDEPETEDEAAPAIA